MNAAQMNRYGPDVTTVTRDARTPSGVAHPAEAAG